MQFFHPPGPPMPHPHAHPHHPFPIPPQHQIVPPTQHVAPIDPRPVSEIFCDAMKRKNHQEKSDSVQPYWSGRGSYRTNVEDMDPSLRPQPFQPTPLAPPMVGMPMPGHMGPAPPHGPPHAMQPGMNMPMGPNFPPYVMPTPPMGMMNMPPPPQSQVWITALRLNYSNTLT